MSKKTINIGQALGLDASKSDIAARMCQAQVEVPDHSGNPLVPPVDPGYVFQDRALAEALTFLITPMDDALMLTGPTGCGKTSLILQIAARLGWACCSLTAHEELEFSSLVGQYVMKQGEGSSQPAMQWQYGPLAMAMKYGFLFVLNEQDLVRPGELSGLNDILEGRPLVIAETGEVIYPHADFRYICTGNTAGAGDPTGAYVGTQVQNIAAMDRYRVMEVNYPSADVELDIIEKATGGAISTVADKMVELAGHVRTAFQGGEGSSHTLGITMSTRSLLRWAKLVPFYGNENNPLRAALDAALTRKAMQEDKVVIDRLAEDVFGEWATNE